MGHNGIYGVPTSCMLPWFYTHLVTQSKLDRTNQYDPLSHFLPMSSQEQVIDSTKKELFNPHYSSRKQSSIFPLGIRDAHNLRAAPVSEPPWL